MIKIAPSMASGPQTHLSATLQELESAGVDSIHFDIEDGHFVPVMNLGVKMIGELRPLTALPFDVHLMVAQPEWLIPELGRMGVNQVSVHYEACPYPRRTLGMISQHGMRPGLAFNPATPIPPLEFCSPYLAFVLLLSTEPEPGDCPFLPSVLDKLVEGRRQPGLEGVEWAVDGGITADNIRQVVEAGAQTVVSGRGVFAGGRIAENILRLRQNCVVE